MTYEILIAMPGNFYGHAAGEWDTNIGDGNAFESITEAEETIDALAKLGAEWEVLYAIREVGQSYLVGTYDRRQDATV